jgi:hypothetical protein
MLGITVHDVKYDDINNIELTSEEVRGRRGRRTTKYYIVVHRKSGGDVKIDASGGVGEEGGLAILEGAKARGVKFVGEDFDEPMEEPVEPAEQPMEPVEQPVEPVEQPMERD